MPVFLQTLPPFVLLSQKHGGPSLILTAFEACLLALALSQTTSRLMKYPCPMLQFTRTVPCDLYLTLGVGRVHTGLM